ncbi:hypothetical protein [Rhodococcus sp. BS-15]|uniref:hypothetical protein n=1 Tax=Rhodococcus sp. BS-15 TaxID=1304954 RepID=UPI001F3B3F83|nr:hypothetical protein [Rhodococcus sp. BS-15]
MREHRHHQQHQQQERADDEERALAQKLPRVAPQAGLTDQLDGLTGGDVAGLALVCGVLSCARIFFIHSES